MNLPPIGMLSLFILLSLFAPHQTHANGDDLGDDFLMWVVIGAIPAALQNSSTSVRFCKKGDRLATIKKSIKCGTDGYSVQHHYFVFFVNDTVTPADIKPVVTAEVMDKVLPLNNSMCGPEAEIVGPTKIPSDEGADEYDVPDVIPKNVFDSDIEKLIAEEKAAGRIPVFFKMTIKNGLSKEITIYATPFCIDDD